MSALQEFLKRIRNDEVVGRLLPLEASLSLPVPCLEDNALYMRFFAYRMGDLLESEGRIPVYEPHIWMTLTYPDGFIKEFTDMDVGANGGRDTVIDYLPLDGPKLDYRVLRQRREELLKLLDSIIPILGREQLSIEERSRVIQYHQLLEQIVEPFLMPFYANLSRGFFRWLKRCSDTPSPSTMNEQSAAAPPPPHGIRLSYVTELLARQWLEGQGYITQPSAGPAMGYDFLAMKPNSVLLVETKGTSRTDDTILMSKSQFECAQLAQDAYLLLLVIVNDKDPLHCSKVVPLSNPLHNPLCSVTAVRNEYRLVPQRNSWEAV